MLPGSAFSSGAFSHPHVLCRLSGMLEDTGKPEWLLI